MNWTFNWLRGEKDHYDINLGLSFSLQSDNRQACVRIIFLFVVFTMRFTKKNPKVEEAWETLKAHMDAKEVELP